MAGARNSGDGPEEDLEGSFNSMQLSFIPDPKEYIQKEKEGWALLMFRASLC